MDTFVINEKTYKVRKLNAFRQLHVVRRIAPILKELLPEAVKMSKLQKQGSDLSEVSEDETLKMITPVMEGFSRLSDIDSEYVIKALLEGAEVQQAQGNWARVATPENGLMFQDMDLMTMLQLSARVFMYNLSGFFGALPQVSHG